MILQNRTKPLESLIWVKVEIWNFNITRAHGWLKQYSLSTSYIG